MKAKLILFGLIFSVMVYSCKEKAKEVKKKTETPAKHVEVQNTEKIHWSYIGDSGPEHWADIETDSGRVVKMTK